MEGESGSGPWVYGRKIVTHSNYDFYNVGQHPLFDQDRGRLIYFEGTYTTGFSSNQNKTPLYDYNQLMYRLSLNDQRLSLPAPVYLVKSNQKKVTFLMREGMDQFHQWEHLLSIPFYAIPLISANDHYIPIYSQESKYGTKLSISAGAGTKKPVFYALPADTVLDATKSIVPLFEYRKPGNGGIFYSTDLSTEGTNAIRSEKPVCLVWLNPSSILAHDYKAIPERLNK